MDPDTPASRPRRSRSYNGGTGAPTDQELVAMLQYEASVGVEGGPAWQDIRVRTWDYALRTVRKFILDGSVWRRHRRLGGPSATDLRIPPDGVDREVAHDLASDAVASALPILREQLIAGRWDPARGAALRTWMVNLCILRLVGPWRIWLRGVNREVLGDVPETESDTGRPEAVIYAIEFERTIELLDNDIQRAAMLLDCAGLTDAEISLRLDRTPKSVEYQLSVARTRLRQRLEAQAAVARQRGIA